MSSPTGPSQAAASPQPALERQIGPLQATAINMTQMCGIGPFVTIPAMVATIGGPEAMFGWIIGAILALADGLIWAELGAGSSESSAKASARAGKDHLARPYPLIPFPLEVMGMLFTENAANSSLQHTCSLPRWNLRELPRLIRRAAVQSQCLPTPVWPGINHAG